MPPRVLHVLDSTTPPDALDMLRSVLDLADHRIVALGHHATRQIAESAGIEEPITFLYSTGWADPSGWRALRRTIRAYQPTHVHAWGIPAAMAMTMTRFSGTRLVTLVDLPRRRHLQLLPFIHKGGLWVSAGSCHWTVSTTWLRRELHAHAIPANAVTIIRPGVVPLRLAADGTREELGMLPSDGPVLLLGGDGGSSAMLAQPGLDPAPFGGCGGPRHDLGLWAAAILQTMFPRLRAIVRRDPRGNSDPGLERLMHDLPDDDVVVVAPAEWPWAKLLAIADVLLVTPDGPMATGSILAAFGARVPVVGTPVDAVREHITDGHNGILTASTHPRAIASALECFFHRPDRGVPLAAQALTDAEARHDAERLRASFAALYDAGAGAGNVPGNVPGVVAGAGTAP